MPRGPSTANSPLWWACATRLGTGQRSSVGDAAAIRRWVCSRWILPAEWALRVLRHHDGPLGRSSLPSSGHVNLASDDLPHRADLEYRLDAPVDADPILGGDTGRNSTASHDDSRSALGFLCIHVAGGNGSQRHRVCHWKDQDQNDAPLWTRPESRWGGGCPGGDSGDQGAQPDARSQWSGGICYASGVN